MCSEPTTISRSYGEAITFSPSMSAPEKVLSQADRVNIIIALNKDTILFHKDELEKSGAIIYDADQITVSAEELERDDIKLIHVPLEENRKRP